MKLRNTAIAIGIGAATAAGTAGAAGGYNGNNNVGRTRRDPSDPRFFVFPKANHEYTGVNLLSNYELNKL